MTNHDYYRPYKDSTKLCIIPGIEVSTSLGHVLLVGSDPPETTVPGTLTPTEVTNMAHNRGCVAILAHPFRNSAVAEDGAALDAVEVNGKTVVSMARVERLANGLDLPVVGGSDAHFPFEVGRAYTKVYADALTPEAVVEAIYQGRVEASIDDRFSNRVLQGGYDRIHTYKGHT